MNINCERRRALGCDRQDQLRQTFPCDGMSRIRFKGYDLSLAQAALQGTPKVVTRGAHYHREGQEYLKIRIETMFGSD